jgi:hypothetical protein
LNGKNQIKNNKVGNSQPYFFSDEEDEEELELSEPDDPLEEEGLNCSGWSSL